MHKTTDATMTNPSQPASSVRAERKIATREALIRCGVALCTERGFHMTGIEEVLKRVGVPKGSFYHFFSTKREFGEAVIDNYSDYFFRKLDRVLSDESQSPIERLRSFTLEAREGMHKYQYRRGCLVGNLGQELSGLDDEFRTRLESVLLSWQMRTAQCLVEAQDAGEISKESDAAELAEFFWIGWEGAILRAKLSRSSAPMELFANMFFKKILG